MKALDALLLPLVVLCCTAVVVAAGRNAAAVKGLQRHAATLVTSYYEVSEPTVQPSTRAAVRPGRTALAITFSEPAVSKHMAVIVPTADGMVHDAVDSWQAHKNLAVMFKSLKSINAQSGSNQPHLFPQGTIALQAAGNAATPEQRDVQGLLGVLEASGKRPAWATENFSSLMLWPYDQPTAAVADLIEVLYDEPSGLVTLEVDVVDNPHTITEFTPHQRGPMDVNNAHYHFNTRPGVNIDAPALLKSLATPDHKVKDLLVFEKRKGSTCWYVDISASPSTTATVGSDVIVTISNIIVNCGVCSSVPGCAPPSIGRPGNLTWTASGTDVAFTVTGPAAVVDVSEYVSDPTRTGVQQTASSVEGVAQTVNGEAWVKLRVADVGPINLVVDVIDKSLVHEPNDIIITGVAAPSVAKLVLLPVKAYRHVHDSIILTVTAVDASYAPVANANVSVSAFGDCQPVSANTLVTTDVFGRASVTLGVDRPGAMAVVAAAVNALEGVAVLSEPANVIFFEDHGYIDDRERDYYGGEGGHQPGGHHYQGDAQSYAKAAAARAVQQLGT